MRELIGAFILYQFNAGPIWWGAYIAILVLSFLSGVVEGYHGHK